MQAYISCDKLMTDDAIRRQKADLLLEHKETEDYLRVLKDKVIAVFSAVNELREIVFAHAAIGNHLSSKYARPITDKHRDAFDFQGILDLLAEIEKTEMKFKELSQRRSDLNL